MRPAHLTEQIASGGGLRDKAAVTIEDSFATLQTAILSTQVHQQRVCCLRSAAKINTIVVVPVESLTGKIPAAHAPVQF